MGCVWKAKQTLWQNKIQSSSRTNRVKADSTWDACTLLQLSSFSDWRDEGRWMVEGWGGYRRVWESSRSVHSPLCCWQCRPCQPPACLPPRGEAFCRCLPRSWHGPRPTCPQSPGWLCRFCRWLCLRNGESGKGVKNVPIRNMVWWWSRMSAAKWTQECYVVHSPTRFLGTWK